MANKIPVDPNLVYQLMRNTQSQAPEFVEPTPYSGQAAVNKTGLGFAAGFGSVGDTAMAGLNAFQAWMSESDRDMNLYMEQATAYNRLAQAASNGSFSNMLGAAAGDLALAAPAGAAIGALGAGGATAAGLGVLGRGIGKLAGTTLGMMAASAPSTYNESVNTQLQHGVQPRQALDDATLPAAANAAMDNVAFIPGVSRLVRGVKTPDATPMSLRDLGTATATAAGVEGLTGGAQYMSNLAGVNEADRDFGLTSGKAFDEMGQAAVNEALVGGTLAGGLNLASMIHGQATAPDPTTAPTPDTSGVYPSPPAPYNEQPNWRYGQQGYDTTLNGEYIPQDVQIGRTVDALGRPVIDGELVQPQPDPLQLPYQRKLDQTFDGEVIQPDAQIGRTIDALGRPVIEGTIVQPTEGIAPQPAPTAQQPAPIRALPMPPLPQPTQTQTMSVPPYMPEAPVHMMPTATPTPAPTAPVMQTTALTPATTVAPTPAATVVPKAITPKLSIPLPPAMKAVAPTAAPTEAVTVMPTMAPTVPVADAPTTPVTSAPTSSITADKIPAIVAKALGLDPVEDAAYLDTLMAKVGLVDGDGVADLDGMEPDYWINEAQATATKGLKARDGTTALSPVVEYKSKRDRANRIAAKSAAQVKQDDTMDTADAVEQPTTRASFYESVTPEVKAEIDAIIGGMKKTSVTRSAITESMNAQQARVKLAALTSGPAKAKAGQLIAILDRIAPAEQTAAPDVTVIEDPAELARIQAERDAEAASRPATHGAAAFDQVMRNDRATASAVTIGEANAAAAAKASEAQAEAERKEASKVVKVTEPETTVAPTEAPTAAPQKATWSIPSEKEDKAHHDQMMAELAEDRRRESEAHEAWAKNLNEQIDAIDEKKAAGLRLTPQQVMGVLPKTGKIRDRVAALLADPAATKDGTVGYWDVVAAVIAGRRTVQTQSVLNKLEDLNNEFIAPLDEQRRALLNSEFVYDKGRGQQTPAKMAETRRVEDTGGYKVTSQTDKAPLPFGYDNTLVNAVRDAFASADIHKLIQTLRNAAQKGAKNVMAMSAVMTRILDVLERDIKNGVKRSIGIGDTRHRINVKSDSRPSWDREQSVRTQAAQPETVQTEALQPDDMKLIDDIAAAKSDFAVRLEELMRLLRAHERDVTARLFAAYGMKNPQNFLNTLLPVTNVKYHTDIFFGRGDIEDIVQKYKLQFAEVPPDLTESVAREYGREFLNQIIKDREVVSAAEVYEAAFLKLNELKSKARDRDIPRTLYYNAAGHFTPATGEAKLAEDINDNDVMETVLHELSHAVTHARLRLPDSPAAIQIEQLYNAVLEHLGGNIVGDFQYFLSNVDEFVVGSMSNARFADYLNSLNLNKTKQTVLSKLVESIKKFLGFALGKDHTVYSELMAALDALMDADITDTQSVNHGGTMANISQAWSAVTNPTNIANTKATLRNLADVKKGFAKIREGYGSTMAMSIRAATWSNVRALVGRYSPQIGKHLHDVLKTASRKHQQYNNELLNILNVEKNGLTVDENNKVYEMFIHQTPSAKAVTLLSPKQFAVFQQIRAFSNRIMDQVIRPMAEERFAAQLATLDANDPEFLANVASIVGRAFTPLVDKQGNPVTTTAITGYAIDAKTGAMQQVPIASGKATHVLKEELNDFAPRIWDYDALKNAAQFAQDMVDRGVVKDIDEGTKLHMAVLGGQSKVYRDGTDIVITAPNGHLKGRKIQISNYAARGYIDTTPSAMSIYLNNVILHSEFVQEFGPYNVTTDAVTGKNTVQFDRKNSIADLINSQKNDDDRAILYAAIAHALREDLGRGVLQPLRAPLAWTKAIISAATMYMIVPVSLSEVAYASGTQHTARERKIARNMMAKHLRQFITSMFKQNFSRVQQQERFETMGLLASKISDRVANEMADLQSVQGWEGKAHNFANGAYSRFGMHGWSRFINTMAADIAIALMQEKLRILNSPNASADDIAKANADLEQFDVSRADLEAWVKAGMPTLEDADPSVATATENAINAVYRYQRTIAAKPDSMSETLWARVPGWDMIFLFKGFFFSAATDILPRLLSNKKADGSIDKVDTFMQIAELAIIGAAASGLGLFAAHAVKYGIPSEILEIKQPPFAISNPEIGAGTKLTEISLNALTALSGLYPFVSAMERPGGVVDLANIAVPIGFALRVSDPDNFAKTLVQIGEAASMYYAGGAYERRQERLRTNQPQQPNPQ